ncbi:MAG: class II aldolase/adducin family protein [Ignavibacteriae bacterium]|nr:class II aldolase/adducin family protein [Ignavibacteriota bacterium]
MKEGVIKFNYDWKKKALPASLDIGELVRYRNKLFSYGLIGADENGIGFGNISVRYMSSGKFNISASNTGKIKRAGKYHFTMVNSVDVKKNFVSCTGMMVASSESMTHDIIYNLSSGIKCVIHVHNLRLWKKFLNKVPTTSKTISYGTPEMANDIRRLWVKSDLKEKRILAMAGHEGGLVVFGESLEEAYSLIMKYFNG